MGQQFTTANNPMQDTTTSSAGDAIIKTSTVSRKNRAYVTSQNAMAAEGKSKASVIQSQIDALDAQINSLVSQISSDMDVRDKAYNLYNQLNAEISDSNRLQQGDLRKLKDYQMQNKVTDRDNAYNRYQTYSVNINSLTTHKDELLSQRNALADQLTAMGKPVSRRPNMVIEGKSGASVIDSIKNTVQNVADNISNTIGGSGGGGGFNPSAQELQDMTAQPDGGDANPVTALKKNPLVMYAAIGVGAYLFYKFFIKK